MTPDPHDDPELLFARWAEAAEDGEAPEFLELVADHPRHAESLRQMHADWLRFTPLLAEVVPGNLETLASVLRGWTPGEETLSDTFAERELDALGLSLPEGGRYRFRGVLGRGGGGVVLRVWDRKLGRPLAMKVVLDQPDRATDVEAQRLDAASVSRFVDEARIASQLEHPGIVPVHELGTDRQGRAFFTMRLVSGNDLGAIFAKLRSGVEGWSLVRAVAVLVKVCDAVAYAHERGVLHRDLKPTNVMVGAHGEVHVMDWGLARVRPAAEDGSQTVASLRAEGASADSPFTTLDGSILGTPAYMAPEQARGELSAVDARSDVYSIGAMLYELLAGQAPYAESGSELGALEIVRRVTKGPPARVATLAPQAPDELISICERAMARAPEDRYPSVEQLSADLAAHLEQRVVRAHASGTWAETCKWVKRNRGLASSLLFALVIASSGAVAFAIKAEEANRRSVEAIAARQRSDELVLSGARSANLYADQLLLTSLSAKPIHRPRLFMEGLFELRKAFELDPSDPKPLERIALELGSARTPLRPMHWLEHGGEILDAAFSPDDRLIATAGADGACRLWEVATGRAVAVLQHLQSAGSARCQVTKLSFHPTRPLLVTTVDDGRICWWDLETRKLVHEVVHPSPPTLIAFSPDGHRLAAGFEDGHLRVWGTLERRLLLESPQNDDKPGEHPLLDVNSLAWQASGQRFAFSRRNSGIRTVSLDGGTETVVPWHPDDQAEVVTFDGDRLVVFCGTAGAAVLDPRESWTIETRVFPGEGYARRVTSSANRSMVAFIEWDGADNTICLSSLSDDHTSRRLVKSPAVEAITLAADGTRIAEIASGLIKVGKTRLPHSGVRSAVFSHDGSSLLSYGIDGFAGLWSLAVHEGLGFRWNLGFSCDLFGSFTLDNEALVLVPFYDGEHVHALQSDNGAELDTRFWSNASYPHYFIHSRGAYMEESNSETSQLVHWSPIDKRLVNFPEAPRKKDLRFADFGTDGRDRRWLCWIEGRFLVIWNSESKTTKRLPHHESLISANFTLSAQKLTAVTKSGHVVVWTLSGESIADFVVPGAEKQAHPVLLSADGTLCYLGREVWDVENGRRVGVFAEGGIQQIVPHPHRRRALILNKEGNLHQWDTNRMILLHDLGRATEVSFASYDPSGHRIALVARNQLALLDAATGFPLLRQPQDSKYWGRLAFSSDGSRLVCTLHDAVTGDFGDDDLVRLLDFRLARDLAMRSQEVELPDLDAFLRFATNQCMSESGHLRRLTREEDTVAKMAVQGFVAANHHPLAPLSRWLLAEGPSAPAWLGATISRRERATILLTQGEGLAAATRLDPLHPNLPILRAAKERDPQRASALRKLALERLFAEPRTSHTLPLYEQAMTFLLDQKQLDAARTIAKAALQIQQDHALSLKVLAPPTQAEGR